MTDADKIMHPQHFGTDPMDIQIRINPKIRIWIPDHFCFKFWCRRRFALSECSCSNRFCVVKPSHALRNEGMYDISFNRCNCSLAVNILPHPVCTVGG